MIDISFTGGWIDIKMGSFHTQIVEFSDEGSPVEVDDVEVTGEAVTLNGQAVYWRKPSLYHVTVTVIPGSQNDLDLQRMLHASKVQNGESVTPISELTVTMTINAPKINESNGSQQTGRKWTFKNGRFLRGKIGMQTDPEGKMSAMAYSFAFEQCETSGSATSVSSQH